MSAKATGMAVRRLVRTSGGRLSWGLWRSAACLLPACATETVGSSLDYATDTWAKPTSHGELSFDDRNTADFTSSERFHGWHFTLTPEAEVALETAPSTQNLDTVLYLYNADEAGTKHGSYLAKNDDADGTTMASKLTETLAAGTYFVQVKAAHELMTGRFDLNTGCTGAGCPFNDLPTVEDHCDSAYEDIGKCVDDSLDATEEGCAPDASVPSAVLCCNQTDQWFCEDVCGDALQLAEIWGTNLDRAIDAFPTTEWHDVMNAGEYALATCAGPTLAEVETAILDADELIAEGSWNVDGWVDNGATNFVAGDVTQELLDAVSGIAGEPVTARWSASVEVPCQSCTNGYTKNAFFFATAGKLILIESNWGED
jgi:hypothetical protein